MTVKRSSSLSPLSGSFPPDRAKIVRIASTKALDTTLCSEPYLSELSRRPELRQIGASQPLAFDSVGQLID